MNYEKIIHLRSHKVKHVVLVSGESYAIVCLRNSKIHESMYMYQGNNHLNRQTKMFGSEYSWFYSINGNTPCSRITTNHKAKDKTHTS